MLVRAGPMIVACAALLATPAFAQTAGQPPDRNAITWGGERHQPSQGAIRSSEKQAGVALPKSKQRKQTQTVERIDHKLLGKKASPP